MSPRPRKVSDDELFAATQAVMNRVGPGELTLATIAREAGVTAAVLVQRFKDEVVLSEVNEIEALTSALSGRIWQKIRLLDRALEESQG